MILKLGKTNMNNKFLKRASEMKKRRKKQRQNTTTKKPKLKSQLISRTAIKAKKLMMMNQIQTQERQKAFRQREEWNS